MDGENVNYYLKFKTPHNFGERSEVREVGHQIIIDAMDGQCKVHTIKCPKQQDDEPIKFCPSASMLRPKVDISLNAG
ncbi:hypothetical protein CY34DRAFT_807995 [Suillus luteus UH-Slu-Lm8-n1]|uniref:Uncharacterized protein n=1 Tax=Suillus luteus UH-Slu-Lm8-n1 TaxID=930992 RepID=A0A0D0ANW0_9AGAM|nr:hypothetical protein CY34DRAFT_807995 [Suillus luteus UH-Slu-Lm8-n1]